MIAHGLRTLKDEALAGRLRPDHLWRAVRGAGRYVAAIATGQAADPDTARRRAAVCAECKSRTTVNKHEIGAVAGYCGTPFEVGTEPPTCGCLVTLTAHGVTTPAGKCCVAPETCPQGLW